MPVPLLIATTALVAAAFVLELVAALPIVAAALIAVAHADRRRIVPASALAPARR